ncbi:calcineurin is a calcium-dependent protein [Rutstroemia sp. NJR-2017a WRK4]|nr:calcineurin is a calcium-dependent protein [Rutstroemia sp. NJR-2017a WRK4]
MSRARKPLGVADLNATTAAAPHDDETCPKEKYRDWPVQEDLESVSTELRRAGCKTPMWEIIDVPEKEYKNPMSCETLGFEVGSKNVVCRKGWEFFRQLEKEMKEEERFIFDSKEQYLRWMERHRTAENEIDPTTALNGEQTFASTTMPIRAKKEKGGKTPTAMKTDTKTMSAKGSSDPEASVTKKPKKTTAKECDMVDVSSIELPGEEDETVEVYDTCDSLREKISDYLEEGGITQAGFLREVSKCLPGGKKISSAQLKTFMAKVSPKAGNTTGIFYVGYCYFKKLRIANDEEKSDFREEMEEIWDRSTHLSGRPGFDVWTAANQRHIGSANASLRLDE